MSEYHIPLLSLLLAHGILSFERFNDLVEMAQHLVESLVVAIDPRWYA